MRVLTGVTTALVLLAIVSYGLLDSWYHDDQCMIEQWKCSAGGLGLVGILLFGPLAALSTLVTLIAWVVEAFGSPGGPMDG